MAGAPLARLSSWLVSDVTRLWFYGIRVVLSLLILTILAALAAGTIMTFLGIATLVQEPIEVVLRQVIINTLLLLALVEVFRTTLAYFTEGRVKVTFIVDTILVVMLTEVISEWFKGGPLEHMALLGGTLLTLGLMRAMAVRFSPARRDNVMDTPGQ